MTESKRQSNIKKVQARQRRYHAKKCVIKGGDKSMDLEMWDKITLGFVSEHQRYYSISISPSFSDQDQSRASILSCRYQYYIGVLGDIRLGIEKWGYNLSHQNDLNIILQFLREVNDSFSVPILEMIVDCLDVTK